MKAYLSLKSHFYTMTDAMEMFLSLPPLDSVILVEAKMAAYRMQGAGIWSYHRARLHTGLRDFLKMKYFYNGAGPGDKIS